MRGTRDSTVRAGIAGLTALLCACSQGGGASTDELRQVRDDVADLRADMRELREEMRSVRAEVRQLRDDETDGATAAGDKDEPEKGDKDGNDADAKPVGTTAGKKPAAGRKPPAETVLEPPPKQSTVKISVDSNPRGAKVYLAGKVMGRTPVLLERVPGTDEISVRIEKEGYRARLLSIRPDEDTKLSVQLAKK